MTMVSSSELLAGPSVCSVIFVSKQMNIMSILSNFIKISYILILIIICNIFMKKVFFV